MISIDGKVTHFVRRNSVSFPFARQHCTCLHGRVSGRFSVWHISTLSFLSGRERRLSHSSAVCDERRLHRWVILRSLGPILPFSPFLSIPPTDSTDSLPLANTPEVFGLHLNAEINYYSQAAWGMWNHLIELQPQTGELWTTPSASQRFSRADSPFHARKFD